MSRDDDRSRRWLAYHLGELSEEERKVVEAELAALGPDADAKEALLAETVRSWASEPVEYTPADPDAIAALGRVAPSPAPLPVRRRFGRPALWAGGLAAAALVLLALSPLQFTIQVGPATVAWGQPVDKGSPELQAELLALRQQVEALTHASQQTQTELASVQQRNASLEQTLQQTATALAEDQKAETLARYHDVQQLARIVSANGAYTAMASAAEYGQ